MCSAIHGLAEREEVDPKPSTLVCPFSDFDSIVEAELGFSRIDTSIEEL